MMQADRIRIPDSKRWCAIALLLATLVLISIVNTGYRYFCDNHALQLPLVEKTLDSSLFPHDPFVETLDDYESWVWLLIAQLARVVDLRWVLLAFFLLTRILLVVSSARLCAVLVPDSPVAIFLAAALAGLAPQSIVGNGNLTEVYFEQTSLFIPIFMLALAYLLECKTARFHLFWAAAFLVNPMYGSWARVFFACTYLADPERPSPKAMVASSPIFIALVTPIFLQGLRALTQPKPDLDLWSWAIRLLNSPHLAPSTWPPILIRHFGFFVGLVLVVAVLVRSSFPRIWRLTTIWSVLAVAFLILGLVVGRGDRWLKILVMQPARATDLFYLSAGMTLVGATAELARRRLTVWRFMVSTSTFSATAFLLAPSFRNFAIWPTLVGGSLIAVFLGVWHKRRPDNDSATEKPPVAQPKRRVLVNPSILISVAVFAVLLVAMKGSFQERAEKWGSVEKALYRGPDEQIAAIAAWARTSTPDDAVFFHDPIDWEWSQFRYLAARSVYATWKDASAVLWAPSYTDEWSRRFAAFGLQGKWRDHWDISRRGEIAKMRQSMRRRARRLRDSDLATMRSEFEINYWIAPTKTRSKHPVIFATEDYKVFRLD